MFGVQSVARTVFEHHFHAAPTELDCPPKRRGYRHGAPNGAFAKPARPTTGPFGQHARGPARPAKGLKRKEQNLRLKPPHTTEPGVVVEIARVGVAAVGAPREDGDV